MLLYRAVSRVRSRLREAGAGYWNQSVASFIVCLEKGTLNRLMDKPDRCLGESNMTKRLTAKNSIQDQRIGKAAMRRRSVLKTLAWAAPLCVAGGAMQLLQGCSKKSDASASDIVEIGARTAVERINKGEMKAENYVGELIKRLNTLKFLNTVITIDEARVLSDARAVDQARARGDKLGALAGLPFAVKDQIAVAGYPATAGNIKLKGYIPKQHAPVVDAVLKAGGVMFAKANCAAMAGQVSPSGATASNPYFGPVRNPYSPAHMSGGSSGGSGAIVAARIVPAALGEDSGGSIRLPAACCGIAGLRPSTFSLDNFLEGTDHKRYSSDGIVPGPAQLVDTFGPFARSVADVAFLDAVITGEETPQVSLRGTRIGVPRDDYWARDIIDPGVMKVTKDALAKLRDAGAELVEVDLNGLMRLDEGGILGRALRRGSGNSLAEWLAENLPSVTADEVNQLRDSYPRFEVSAPPPLSQEEKTKIVTEAKRQYAEAFQSSGILALAFPTLLIPPPLINSNGDTPGQKIFVNGKWVDEFDTIITNIFWGPRIGAPGLSVPSGMTAGLPVSLQLQGMPGSDAKIVGLGIEVEKVLGHLPAPSPQKVISIES